MTQQSNIACVREKNDGGSDSIDKIHFEILWELPPHNGSFPKLILCCFLLCQILSQT